MCSVEVPTQDLGPEGRNEGEESVGYVPYHSVGVFVWVIFRAIVASGDVVSSTAVSKSQVG